MQRLGSHFTRTCLKRSFLNSVICKTRSPFTVRGIVVNANATTTLSPTATTDALALANDRQNKVDDDLPDLLPASSPNETNQNAEESHTLENFNTSDERIEDLRTKYSLPAFLRPYQVQVIDECLAAFDRGLTRIGVSSPTASGKTTMFTHLIPSLRARGTAKQVLIVVGAIELAIQARDAVKAALPDLEVELEQGASRASGKADVTIATYQSLRPHRLSAYNPLDFCAVIVDEAHHAVSPSYRKLLKQFNDGVEAPLDFEEHTATNDSNPEHEQGQTNSPIPLAPIIGFSATWARHDGIALSSVFEEIVYHGEIKEMFDSGYLAPAEFISIKANLELEKLSVGKSGDFNPAGLSQGINTPYMNELLVNTYIQQAETDRASTLVFCVDINHIEELVTQFRQKGIDARGVSSKTEPLHRRQLLQDFMDKKFPVLINCGILLEGTNIPNIDCIIVARPTLSLTLLSQMIGRGLRTSPGKEYCRVIDFVDSFRGEGKLVSVPTLLGIDANKVKRLGEEDEAVKQKDEPKQPVIPLPEIKSPYVIKSVSYLDVRDPFGLSDPEAGESEHFQSEYSWVACGKDKYAIYNTIKRGSEVFIISKEDGLWVAEHRFRVPDTFTWAPLDVTMFKTLQSAILAVDKKIKALQKSSLMENSAPWRQAPATKPQIESLRQKMAGLGSEQELENFLTRITKGEAVDYLTALKFGALGNLRKLVQSNKQLRRKQEKEAQKASKSKRRARRS